MIEPELRAVQQHPDRLLDQRRRPSASEVRCATKRFALLRLRRPAQHRQEQPVDALLPRLRRGQQRVGEVALARLDHARGRCSLLFRNRCSRQAALEVAPAVGRLAEVAQEILASCRRAILPPAASKPVAVRSAASNSSADSGRTRARSNHVGSASVAGPAPASWYVSLLTSSRISHFRSNLCADELLGQRLEQFRVAGGVLVAEVVHRVDEAAAQELRPDAVGDRPGEVRVVRGRHPGGQLLLARERRLRQRSCRP